MFFYPCCRAGFIARLVCRVCLQGLFIGRGDYQNYLSGLPGSLGSPDTAHKIKSCAMLKAVSGTKPYLFKTLLPALIAWLLFLGLGPGLRLGSGFSPRQVRLLRCLLKPQIV